MQFSEVMGIIPAAGQATRMSPIPCSKEILPIGFKVIAAENKTIPKVSANYLIDYLKLGGVRSILMVIKKGKWDIPAYFGNGEDFGVEIGYLITNLDLGVPFTINQAHNFVKNNIVLFGFPDILIDPADAYEILLNHYKSSQSDITLGVFPAEDPKKWDMVGIDETGNVNAIQIKPVKTSLKYCWAIACWGPRFTEYINEFCQNQVKLINAGKQTRSDFHLGDCLIQSMDHGLTIDTVAFDHGRCLDIGTPDDFKKLVKGEVGF